MGGFADQNGDFSHANSTGFNPNIGRWPANLIHDGSEEVVGLFPYGKSGSNTPKNEDGYRGQRYSGGWKSSNINYFEANEGSAARFFYCAKASKEDRDEGCEGLHSLEAGVGALRDGGRQSEPRGNHHPTVKPTELMRYLCRLVTPPNGVVLDPFAGSGSTGKGAILEGFCFVGIEMEADHVAIAHARLEFAAAARAEAEVLERNKAGEIVITAKEAAQGKASLFDWQGGADD
jgi:DNA modification methylase